MHSLAKCLKVWEKDERNENNNNNQNTARNLFRAYFFSVVVAVVCLLIFFVSYKMECKMQLIPTKKKRKKRGGELWNEWTGKWATDSPKQNYRVVIFTTKDIFPRWHAQNRSENDAGKCIRRARTPKHTMK